MRKQTFAAGILAAVVLAGCVKDINTDSEANLLNKSRTEKNGVSPFTDADPFVPGEVIIKFKSGVPQTGIANALTRIGGKMKEHVLTGAMKQTGDQEGFYVVSVPAGVLEAIERMKGMADVEYAEPNYIYSIPKLQQATDANDPFYSSTEAKNDNLWGMMGMLTYPYKNNYASRAAEAWSDLYPDDTFLPKDTDSEPDRGTSQQTGSENVYIAVIDQGVDDDHPDFQIKDDNGIIIRNNVATQYGYDVVSNDNDPDPVHASENHGTHVAGTIGAVGNNGIGVAGVCWKVNIISVRFLDHNGYGTAANAVKALDYVIDLKVKDGGPKLNIIATNNSWGGLSSKALQAAIGRSENAGILFVVAAGNSNSNNDRRSTYPSCYSNAGIISVASITVDGTKSDFSSYGQTTVDLAAPGSYIWSTIPATSSNSGYAKMSGTSMATPHVTGAIALYAAAHNLRPVSKSDALAIKEAIMKSTRPTRSFQGRCVSNGRLDVARAVRKDFSALAAD